MEKYQNGFLLGKFYPFHKGHAYLIEEALKRCNKLTVLVCTMKSEQEKYLDGIYRYESMQEYFKGYKNLEIIFRKENDEQYPEHHPKFWNIWLKIILQYIDAKTTDVIFSSENYGNEISKRLGISHCCIDLKRNTFPISGTAVRKSIYKNWEMLPQVTKRHFIKSVAILGPESSYKSRITKDLAKHFNCEYIEEYGREYCEKYPLTPHSFQEIVIRHNENFKTLLKKTENKLIILDTDVITTKIFQSMYFPKDDLIDIYSIEGILPIDLRIILSPNKEAIQDGTRKFITEKEQLKHFQALQSECISQQVVYEIVSGNYKQKLSQCIEYIEELMY